MPGMQKAILCSMSVPWHKGLDCSDLEKLLPSEKEDDDLLLFKLAKEKDWQRCEKCNELLKKHLDAVTWFAGQ